jgi:SpoVK/Ycf46/Vps4 family AAA+-type ATPase
MMQVEEKPDVTYSDVGGCKEQIEKLREVVETPLLHVSLNFPHINTYFTQILASLFHCLLINHVAMLRVRHT